MDGWTLALCALFIAAASFLRGLTGFGFALVAAPLLALVLPPAVAVPIVTLLQIPSGLQTGVSDWSNTDIRAALVIWLSGLPLILPGLTIVAHVDPDTMRLVLGLTVLISTFLMSLGFKIDRAPKTGELIAAGAMSGMMQGAVAMAGPPLILLLLSSTWAPARCRATLSFIFLLMGTASLTIGLWRGIVTLESLWFALLFVPGLFAGQLLGGRLFKHLDARSYRGIAIVSVAATAIAVVARGLSG